MCTSIRSFSRSHNSLCHFHIFTFLSFSFSFSLTHLSPNVYMCHCQLSHRYPSTVRIVYLRSILLCNRFDRMVKEICKNYRFVWVCSISLSVLFFSLHLSSMFLSVFSCAHRLRVRLRRMWLIERLWAKEWPFRMSKSHRTRAWNRRWRTQYENQWRNDKRFENERFH